MTDKPNDDALRIDFVTAMDEFSRTTKEARDAYHSGRATIRERVQEVKRAANKLAGDLAALL